MKSSEYSAADDGKCVGEASPIAPVHHHKVPTSDVGRRLRAYRPHGRGIFIGLQKRR